MLWPSVLGLSGRLVSNRVYPGTQSDRLRVFELIGGSWCFSSYPLQPRAELYTRLLLGMGCEAESSECQHIKSEMQLGVEATVA